MPLCSCSKACCQPSWRPSNQIHSKNIIPILLDVAWPRIKDMGPYLQSLVKRLKDTVSKVKHNMPHKSMSPSPNGHRPTPPEWNSFLDLGSQSSSATILKDTQFVYPVLNLVNCWKTNPSPACCPYFLLSFHWFHVSWGLSSHLDVSV